MKMQGNMTPQQINNHKAKDLIDSEGTEISIFEQKRMTYKVKEDMHKPLHKVKEKQINS
jgi:hypothetical protein